MNVVAFALFAVLLSSVSAQNCQYTDATTGCTYDLTSLALPLSSASFYTHNQTEGTGAGFYEANICAPLSGSVTNNTEGLAVSQSVDGTYYSCGTFASQDFAPYSGLVKDNTLTCQGVQVVYTGGDDCKTGPRSTVINVGCDASGATEIADVTEGLSCDYTIQMWSAAACGEAAATATPSVTISVLVATTESSTPTVSAAAAESATPTVSAAESVAAASESAVATESVAAASESAVAVSESAVATETESVAPTPSAVSITPTASLSDGASPSTTETATASLSFGASPSTTPSLSVGASSGNGSNAWIWWVVGAVAIVLIVIAVGVAGFVVYRKKQQSYDSIGYE